MGSFQNLLQGIDSKFIQIIADEVHKCATKTTSSMFNISADRVLGLSATHTRHWDDEGTNTLLAYFGQPVFEFTLADGIELGILCHYRYIPHFVTMTQNEIDEYRHASKRIGMVIQKIEHTPNVQNKAKLQQELTVLQNNRKKIIRKSEEKTRVCDNVIRQFFDGEEKAIIFCEDSEQEDDIINILRDQNKEMREYSSKRSPAEKFSALRDFKKGTVNFLLGVKMLDEGMDIPHVEKCLVVASSTNPREFIQRRGRILRISKDIKKKTAEMHDLIVLPLINIPQDRELTESEENSVNSLVRIVQGEFDRINQLITSADNSGRVLEQMHEESQRLGIEDRINFEVH
jgi:superfamily II DNA or RNA helicase